MPSVTEQHFQKQLFTFVFRFQVKHKKTLTIYKANAALSKRGFSF